MFTWNIRKMRRLNIATHRDLGYFFSSLILVYCISGLALNHVDDWNPDFVLTKDTIGIEKTYNISEINTAQIQEFGKLRGEEKYKVYDFPTSDQVKIYYENASMHIYLSQNIAIYEHVARR